MRYAKGLLMKGVKTIALAGRVRIDNGQDWYAEVGVSGANIVP
jgi:hypothetical protein